MPVHERILDIGEKPIVNTELGRRLVAMPAGQMVMVATRTPGKASHKCKAGSWLIEDGKFIRCFWLQDAFAMWFAFGEHSDIEIEETFNGLAMPAIYVQG